MPNILTRIMLFLSSYAPLLCIYTLRSWDKYGWWASGFTVVAVLSCLWLWAFVLMSRSMEPTLIQPDSVSTRDSEALVYVASYVIPFVELPFDEWRSAVSLGIFFVMLGVLYINSHMIHINPMLNLIGFHVLEIEVKGEVHSL